MGKKKSEEIYRLVHSDVLTERLEGYAYQYESLGMQGRADLLRYAVETLKGGKPDVDADDVIEQMYGFARQLASDHCGYVAEDVRAAADFLDIRHTPPKDKPAEVVWYAMDVLIEHGCDLHAYGDVSYEQTLADLKEGYPDGMAYPYEDIARAIKDISAPKPPKPPAPYRMAWETADSADCADHESFGAAKADAEDTLINWAVEERSRWEADKPTPEEADDWDYMIYNCAVSVQKYNPGKGGYGTVWRPDGNELKALGWVLVEEMEVAE